MRLSKVIVYNYKPEIYLSNFWKATQYNIASLVTKSIRFVQFWDTVTSR